jgi:hypothetical protein
VTISEIGAALRSKKVSARELTEEALRRVADANPRLNAFITVTEAAARARAAASVIVRNAFKRGFSSATRRSVSSVSSRTEVFLARSAAPIS